MDEMAQPWIRKETDTDTDSITKAHGSPRPYVGIRQSISFRPSYVGIRVHQAGELKLASDSQ